MEYKKIAGASHQNFNFVSGSIFGERYKSCNFAVATIVKCTFIGDFSECNFNFAEFKETAFINATFFRCSFGGASFKRNSFVNCKFYNCNISDSQWSHNNGISTCVFDSQCNLSSVKGLTVVKKDNGSFLIYQHSHNGGEVKEGITITQPTEEETKKFGKPLSEKRSKRKAKEVTHYRSKPPFPEKIKDETQDDHEYYGVYGGWSNYRNKATEKYNWGFGECAFLECSDIELIKEHGKNKSK